VTKVAIALLLASSVALAAPREHIQPVPVPSSLTAAPPPEEEGLPPVKLWDTKILNNEQPPLAALFFNFAVLALIYYRYGKKPAAEALKNRKLSIAKAIEDAQRILREAKGRAKRYRAKLEKVADDAEQGKQTIISTGEGEAEAILRTAEEKAERIKRDATFLVEQEQKQTKLDLVRETVEHAAKNAEELLRKNVTTEDQERLAEEFITKLAKDFEKGLPVA
jgi:F-type H+-transporting ATPase subunit b